MATTFIESMRKKIIRTKTLFPGNIFEAWIYDSYTDASFVNLEILQRARYGQIGGGGIGGETAKDFVKMGVGHIEICDGDHVERKNLPIQNFYADQIGMNKAFALLDNLKRECTGITELIGYPMYFTDTLKVYPDAFAKAQVLTALVDNHRARYEAAEFALAHKIPMITAGISKDMKIASVFVQMPGEACFNCFKGTYKDRNKEDRQMCRHLAVLYPHTAIAAIVAFAITEIVMGRTLPWNYFYLSFTGESINGYVKRNIDCELCRGK